MQRASAVLAIVALGWLAACDDTPPPEGDGGCTTAALCNDVCCAPTDSCIQLACCPAAQSCGDECCTSGSLCQTDGTGAKKCAILCTTNAACPTATPCCTPTSGGKSACVAADAGRACLCTSAFDCGSKCCAPAADSSGNAVGPYVCKPNDGANYNCTTDAGLCTAGGCKASDPRGSYICIKPCSGSGDCGSGKCVSYTLPSDTTCLNTMGCAP